MKTSTKVVIGAVVAVTMAAVLIVAYIGRISMLRNANDEWVYAVSLFKYSLEVEEESHGLSKTFHYTITDTNEPEKGEQTFEHTAGFFGRSDIQKVLNWLDESAPRWSAATK